MEACTSTQVAAAIGGYAAPGDAASGQGVAALIGAAARIWRRPRSTAPPALTKSDLRRQAAAR